MNIKTWYLMQIEDQTRERIMINILEEIKTFEGTQDIKESSHLLNNSYVIRWDTLQEIVHSKHEN